ncbi:MAG: DegT/DnrJ/EryC1/StrS family aminotransferase [Planctomycetales bacterium]|nr:DegT/DnrJ/EryC1/StrS family aminotransferase [Planctomycetales bacterium]
MRSETSLIPLGIFSEKKSRRLKKSLPNTAMQSMPSAWLTVLMHYTWHCAPSISTALAIAYSGADPVLVDIDEEDFNIDVDLIEQAITPRTKAIIPVHLYGQPAKMDRIRAIAEKHSLAIIEDSAQAHAAECNGQRTGSLGTIGCFSFYPGKNLGAFGDGGAITTNDPTIADRVRLLRNYGQVKKNEHSMLGFNCRLDTVQAAVLLVKLAHLDKWTEQRRRVAARYNELLADSDFELPIERSDAKHVYHLYVVRHPERDRFIEELAKAGIFCGIHYPNPLNRAQPFEAARTVPSGLPVCDRISKEIMSLPMYPEMTDEQIVRVAESLNACLAQS